MIMRDADVLRNDMSRAVKDLNGNVSGGMTPPEGLFAPGRRYNAYVDFFRRRYGARLQKVVIDAGFTCPNRDGFLSRGGCTFCDNAAFHPAYSRAEKSVGEQIDEGVEFHRGRYRNTAAYLAYFQAYSNTYASLERLRGLYCAALEHPSVVGIVIGTRPDCVDGEKLDFLQELASGKVLKAWRREIARSGAGGSAAGAGRGCETDGRPAAVAGPGCETGGRPAAGAGREGSAGSAAPLVLEAPVVIVEYGIESCYDGTLRRVNRGHDFAAARRAVEMTAERGLDCGAHFILGLPGETREMMLEECAVINSLPLTTVKFHQLQIVRGTAMEREYADRPEDFVRFTLDGYVDFFTDMLERLRPDLCIERFAGEVPPRFVNETPWGLIRNTELLRLLESRLAARRTWQGRLLP